MQHEPTATVPELTATAQGGQDTSARPSPAYDRILLANLRQSPERTFSWECFLSFAAFKEGMLSTIISVRGGWPTVSPVF
jgi:hypothetical protein